jgi:hypothetical protein
VKLLGCCIPHHVQMFFDHMRTYCTRRRRTDLGPTEVCEVYHTEMLSVRGHAELSHYEERLKLVLGAERMPLALELVTEAAVSGCLKPEALRRLAGEYAFEAEKTVDVQRDILWILEHDGYLAQGPDGYSFVSSLLRDWWRNRYGGMFFVPVMERGK